MQNQPNPISPAEYDAVAEAIHAVLDDNDPDDLNHDGTGRPVPVPQPGIFHGSMTPAVLPAAAAPDCALATDRSAVKCDDGPREWVAVQYVGKGKQRKERGRIGPLCYTHAVHEERWTAATGAITYALAERMPSGGEPA